MKFILSSKANNCATARASDGALWQAASCGAAFVAAPANFKVYLSGGSRL